MQKVLRPCGLPDIVLRTSTGKLIVYSVLTQPISTLVSLVSEDGVYPLKPEGGTDNPTASADHPNCKN